VIQFYADTCFAALDPDSPLILLIGTLQGKVVATAEVAIGRDAVGGLYNVATLLSYRRRGIGTAMTSEGIDEACRAGMVRLELQASPDGQRVYEQAGFRAHGFWTEFQSAKTKVGA
jgi:predicted GNAT family acetyltransferase